VKRVFLTGFMGSGKTTVGRLVAAEMGWEFHDLDRAVEAAAGLSVPELFRAEGAEGFRRREREALLAIRSLPGVHSLGGGALVDPAAREALRGYGPVAYLKAGAEALARRLPRGAEGRPMLEGAGTIEERISRLLAEREPSYLAADWVIDTDGLAPRQSAERVVRCLRAAEAEEGARTREGRDDR
jgi:shikimate kinase